MQGTGITTFPVTIVDVQKVSDGPGGALIFIRAEGPLMDRTGGIAQGMSGSPVYIAGADGVPRVIGAIAFGTGDENNRIGGITPIEAMLRSGSGKLALERPAPGPRRQVVRAATKAAARRLERISSRGESRLPPPAVDHRGCVARPGRAPAENAGALRRAPRIHRRPHPADACHA